MSTAKLINLFKRIALETVKNSSPSDFIIGTVISLTPLKIKINDKMILEDVHFYKLRNAIGAFRVESHCSNPQCSNPINGTCYHELKVGMKVLLGRCQGGERFVVLGELIE